MASETLWRRFPRVCGIATIIVSGGIIWWTLHARARGEPLSGRIIVEVVILPTTFQTGVVMALAPRAVCKRFLDWMDRLREGADPKHPEAEINSTDYALALLWFAPSAVAFFVLLYGLS
jgi:hypothetical protein